jgi:ankyrin repeat protein
MSSSALCIAAKSGNIERVEMLLDASAIVSVVDKRGFSPLMCAAENTAVVDTAVLLIAHGADVNFAAVSSICCLAPLD